MLGFLPLSFRGIPITALTIEDSPPPNNIVHMGAYWKKAKVENIGNKPRKITVEGFIGNSAMTDLEVDILKGLILAPGHGILTLPNIGILTVCVTGDPVFTTGYDLMPIVGVKLEFTEVSNGMGQLQDALGGIMPSAISGAVSDAESAITGGMSSLVSAGSSLI